MSKLFQTDDAIISAILKIQYLEEITFKDNFERLEKE